MRVAVYTRVSTTEQTCENQLRDLRDYCRARGWSDAREYVDTGVSGTKDRRPALDQLMAAVKGRKVDVVVVAAFDRFGRSVPHLVESLELFRHLGVEFISLREQIDTGSPLGQAVFTIIAAIAQLERSLIVERVKAGLRRAKAEGKRLGRPRVAVDVAGIRLAVEQAGSIRAAARRMGVDEKTLRMRLNSAPLIEGMA
jgi:DNA invertase Pin-like site-specific DNA recombinase